MQFGLYSQKVIEHFKNPKNVGEIKNPDGIGIAGNPVCGDLMKITIKVAKNKNGEEYLEDIKFKTLGCAAAIATSSMVTELAMGKTLQEALKISKQDVADALEGLPPIKQHCSNLASEALHKAIEDYLQKKNKNIK